MPPEGCHARQFLLFPADSGSFRIYSSHLNLQAPLRSPRPPPPAQRPVTYPQIVRLSYVEGDVRISRGKPAEKEDAKANQAPTGWEQAVANLPLEQGYSLVTGKGRAEIEFEDASIIYLADNSVLTFNQLTATDGIPFTEIALLSGTATLNVQPIILRDTFHLVTPTDNIFIFYPQKLYARVDSYLDGTAVTPQRDATLHHSRVHRVAAGNGGPHPFLRSRAPAIPRPPLWTQQHRRSGTNGWRSGLRSAVRRCPPL